MLEKSFEMFNQKGSDEAGGGVLHVSMVGA